MRKERPEKQKMSKPDFCKPAALVTFLVGPEDDITKLVVHKEFACYHSTVLRAAFASDFVEGQTQTYRVKDTFPVFQLIDDVDKGEESDHALQSVTAEDMHLVELWVLADKLAVPELQKCAIDHIVQIGVVCEWPAHKTFNYIYENTATDSQLRLLAVQQCRNHKRGVFEKDGECFPKLLLLDMIINSPGIQP
ncbi:uncharacterized protein RAG0_15340 [Rhynchosporium agropyri]|uniref:BTB domain-containing protein n=1 Tax=Rhynchosporium agropyri TaxID=914238 RepID=A0A1E1LKM8_9HELO|nr:uncharacterized protein RAG0_15340 [Rhynchosporium agropyri]